MIRHAALAVLALLAAVHPSAAQDSQFGVAGLGTPERWESVRARTTGGAFAAFDAASPLTDAALADWGRLAAYGSASTSYRTVAVGGEEAELRATRFPTVTVGTPVSSRIVMAGGHAGYLSRSFSLVTRDTIMIRGEPEGLSDEISSVGGVTDLRIAAAVRPHRIIALGASFHLLTGSTRQTMVRRFDDSLTYRATGQVDDVRYDGLGAAGSILLLPGGGLRLAGWIRSDTRLRFESPDSSGTYDLPLAAGGALAWRLTGGIALAGAIDWRDWGGTPGVNSFDTFSWSAGAEVGSPDAPLRFGARGGQLPFGPGAEAPTEFALAAGKGLRFSGGRGVLDVGVERLTREGPGLRETVWTLLIGVTVRP
jgi:hypothetical protein